MTTLMDQEQDSLLPLTRDLKKAAATLSVDEARYLVDYYYQMQHDRIRASNQVRAVVQNSNPCPDCEQGKQDGVICQTCNGEWLQASEPHELLAWVQYNTKALENRIKTGLDLYSMSSELGIWTRSISGIGPVISAGFLAHINIEKAPTAGAIWRFAGQDPTQKWEKKTKRPWNAKLKTLCWKAGESFVKVQNREADYYGHKYAERRVYEDAKNERGDYADQAAAILVAKNIGKDTDAYKAYIQGFLPPAQMYARSKRWAVKLFLAHYHEVAFELFYNKKPPQPYVLEHGGHTHYIAPPNWR